MIVNIFQMFLIYCTVFHYDYKFNILLKYIILKNFQFIIFFNNVSFFILDF